MKNQIKVGDVVLLKDFDSILNQGEIEDISERYVYVDGVRVSFKKAESTFGRLIKVTEVEENCIWDDTQKYRPEWVEKIVISKKVCFKWDIPFELAYILQNLDEIILISEEEPEEELGIKIEVDMAGNGVFTAKESNCLFSTDWIQHTV